MGNLSFKMRAASAVVAIISTLGWVGAAEAAISRKIWDPAYGAALPYLGWSGEVEFEIKDDCLATVTGGSQWVYLGSAGCNSPDSLGIKNATVTLYDLVNGLNGPDQDVTLTYKTGSILSGNNRDIVPRMYIDVADGVKTIKAVQGFYLWPEVTDASFAKASKVGGGEYDAAAFWLSFNGNRENDPLSYFSNLAPEGDYAFLNSCSFDYPATFDLQGKLKTLAGKSCSSNDGIGNAAILRPIPEPEAYLLGLASFGVLGVWARRRRLNDG